MKELLQYLVDFWNATQEQAGVIAEHVASARKGFLRGAGIYLRALVYLALIAFLLPLPFLIAGIALETGWLVSIAGLLWSLTTLALLFTAAPLGILLEVVLKGYAGSGTRYLKMALSVLLIELTFTLFVAIVPLSNNWGAIPIVLLAAAILGILAAQGMRTIFTRKLLGVVTTCTLLIFLASFAFPRSFDAFQGLFPWVDEQLAAIISPEQREARRLAAERSEREREEAAREEAQRQAVRRQVIERQETERQAALRREQERLEAERQAAARREAERQAELRREAERREAARLAAARREAEQRAAAQHEAERREAARQQEQRPGETRVYNLEVGNPILTVMGAPGSSYVIRSNAKCKMRVATNGREIAFEVRDGAGYGGPYTRNIYISGHPPMGGYDFGRSGRVPPGRVSLEGIYPGTVARVERLRDWTEDQ